MNLMHTIITHTLRVPVDHAGTEGCRVNMLVLNLDEALMKSGFKLSADLIRALTSCPVSEVQTICESLIPAVKELIGDNVKHNPYFIDFPHNIPTTEEHWHDCLVDAFCTGAVDPISVLVNHQTINLLDLPKYGRYQHTYEDMLNAHEDLLSHAKGRITVLHLGETLQRESWKLYTELGDSTVPLSDEGRDMLVGLAEVCINDIIQPDFPIRENKALVNAVRVAHIEKLIPIAPSMGILVDTVTDVLRLACALSDGDVTLATPTKFVSLSRRVRRLLMMALDRVVQLHPGKLHDVMRFREEWKRLGERIHPFDMSYTAWSGAQDVFAVAYGAMAVKTTAGEIQEALNASPPDVAKATRLLKMNPGNFMRSVDNLLVKSDQHPLNQKLVLHNIEAVLPKVSARVMLSLGEHLINRVDDGMPQSQANNRMFTNTKGKTWITWETRPWLRSDDVDKCSNLIADEIVTRLPNIGTLIVDRHVEGLALPLTEKGKGTGFNIMPVGSVTELSEDPELNILRFFTHWHQNHQRTDYDLGAIMLDENFKMLCHVSWTSLRQGGFAYYSGDLVRAPNGATEFIDIKLDNVPPECRYIVPQVNLYSGESFADAKESMFGFMMRTEFGKGKPFEPSTVRYRSDMRGVGEISSPVMFMKGTGDKWYAKWMHFFLKGHANYNTIEGNKASTSMLLRAVAKRSYITVGVMTRLMRRKSANTVSWATPNMDKLKDTYGPYVYVGIDVPGGLPDGTKVYSLSNLHELVPK